MSYELIKNYDKSKHLEILEKNDFKFEYLFSSNWNSIEDIPYVLRTHLLDSSDLIFNLTNLQKL